MSERRPGDAYASRAECMETVGAMAVRKGVKYKCRAEPQRILQEVRRVEGQKSFITTGTH